MDFNSESFGRVEQNSKHCDSTGISEPGTCTNPKQSNRTENFWKPIKCTSTLTYGLYTWELKIIPKLFDNSNHAVWNNMNIPILWDKHGRLNHPERCASITAKCWILLLERDLDEEIPGGDKGNERPTERTECILNAKSGFKWVQHEIAMQVQE